MSNLFSQPSGEVPLISRNGPTATKHWPVPTDVRDLDTLNAWLATLPVPQRNVTEEELRTGDREWQAFSFGSAMSREAMTDDPKAQAVATGQNATALAFLLMGYMAASPEGIVYRIRPEMEWAIDPVTDAGLSTVYVRLGKETAA